ncbi:MAG TPA: acetamidase/formamidase family protein [Chthonomonadaceae bacterium]|nr:acetamidase/formamidase family protein [Chthonomonadaceae bacterium]
MAIHEFRPERYYHAIGTFSPVLRVADGDTIATTTIDAGGFDKSDVAVTGGGNPMTGPFFIAGAAPGDTLAVHFDRIYPNRTRGWTGSSLAPNVVDPDYATELPPLKEWKRVDWRLDLDAGTATLTRPVERIGVLTIPMRPMLGCFGVAPDRGQAISTATSGPHGGNMDYKGFEQGVTVYFPIAVEGALLFFGDGHAAQGCGEVVGTGIEVSFDVQLTVRVQKGRKIGWPRAENETHIWTAGNARPLDQALQHATTEMVRWLTGEFGLDTLGAQALLGQCVEYEIANVYDPAYTVVCKLRKSLLPAV